MQSVVTEAVTAVSATIGGLSQAPQVSTFVSIFRSVLIDLHFLLSGEGIWLLRLTLVIVERAMIQFCWILSKKLILSIILP